MEEEKKEDAVYREQPLFFMRCCKKVLFRPHITVLIDRIVLEFTCPYCHRSVTFTTKEDGLKKALDECVNDDTGKEQ